MICVNCGNQMEDGTVYCTNCGGRQTGDFSAFSANAQSGSSQLYWGEADANATGWRAAGQGATAACGGQSYQAAASQPMASQKALTTATGNQRALAMCVYWGLLPLIFCWAVSDSEHDPFVRHHLNQALVLTIGIFISLVLTVVLVGSLLGMFIFVMSIIGTVNASHGEMAELPLIGKIKLLK